MSTTFAFFGGAPGLPELIIVGVIVLLLFGNRLPKVMRSLGQGITEFKKGVHGIEDEIDEAVNKPVSRVKNDEKDPEGQFEKSGNSSKTRDS
ncbi:MAG: twin-arginine translocase TatA/TatE family subunit [Planctomycetes bacterium]|nr:twin-arginine translocase TatA/TatE family subunit [Planctomycetota bacterium]